MSLSKWEDRQSMTSVRSDGSKVGAFWPDGKIQWWGYPVDGFPVGPYDTCIEAKNAVDHSLPLCPKEPNQQVSA